MLRRVWSFPLAAWVVAFLFFIKASILALWIVPLWDIPDETGHFAYARDIASGNGVLPLGEAEISEDIRSNVRQSPTSAAKNWIVQHPPLYHIVAGAAWKCATFFTHDPEWLFRAPRLVSALFGALTLLFIFKIVEACRLSDKSGLAVMVGFSAIPMFSWLSAGTNHDTLVALFGCASTYYFIRFFQSKRISNAYLSVFLMSLAAVTKMTALVALAPLVGLLILEFQGGVKQWAKSSLALVATALAIPGIWLVRNFIEYGDPFATAATLMPSFRLQDNPLETFFTEYLKAQPAIEHFFVNFIGLIGWRGTDLGNPAWFQIQPPFLAIYQVGMFFIVLLTLAWFLLVISKSYNAGKNSDFSRSLLEKFRSQIGISFFFPVTTALGLMALLALTISHQVVSMTVASWLIIPSFAILFALFILSILVFILPIGQKQRPIFYAIIILAFFSFVVLWEVYKIFLLDGRMRATHGRYFYPALGMIIVALIVPTLLMLGKFAERIALPAAGVILYTEAVFCFIRVLPFVSGEGVS